jgi:hypothetical protein
MKTYRNAGALLASSAMLIGFFGIPVAARSAGPQDSEQVTKLLKEARAEAFQLKDDAGEMATFTYQTVTLASHAEAINRTRDHVNALGRTEQKLQAAKATAAPWQRVAIDRMEPFIDELTGYTSAIIEHINQAPKHTAAEYQDYLEANADYSSDLAAIIAQFVDYGQSKERMDRLAAKLEIAPGK